MCVRRSAFDRRAFAVGGLWLGTHYWTLSVIHRFAAVVIGYRCCLKTVLFMRY